MTDTTLPSPERRPFDLELSRLLHPATAFEHPNQVLSDPDLTTHEKRAILASWVSDACAVEAAPALRLMPGGKASVPVDDVLDALRLLDREAEPWAESHGNWRRALRRGRLDRLREWRRRTPHRRRDPDPPPLSAA